MVLARAGDNDLTHGNLKVGYHGYPAVRAELPVVHSLFWFLAHVPLSRFPPSRFPDDIGFPTGRAWLNKLGTVLPTELTTTQVTVNGAGVVTATRVSDGSVLMDGTGLAFGTSVGKNDANGTVSAALSFKRTKVSER